MTPDVRVPDSAHIPALDPLNLRDLMAAVGLTRLVTEMGDGATMWQRERGRYRLCLLDAPDDFAECCAAWVRACGPTFAFGGFNNVAFDAAAWRERAGPATGIEAALWCAVASDGVASEKKAKVGEGPALRAPALEYAQGGGHVHWLSGMAAFLGHGVSGSAGKPGAALAPGDFARVLAGEQWPSLSASEWDALEREGGPRRPRELAMCRWDPAVERSHALRGRAPSGDKFLQDQTVNALAAIGLASCPSAPRQGGLATPLVVGGDRRVARLRWPLWSEPLRLATLEATLAAGPARWRRWPTVEARRWYPGKSPAFARGALREPEATG